MKAYVPDRLYRMLPGVYVISGILALVHLTHFTATISGFLFIGAGLLVFSWRNNARATQRRRQKAVQQRQWANRAQTPKTRWRWE